MIDLPMEKLDALERKSRLNAIGPPPSSS
jgi:hypothetical protein